MEDKKIIELYWDRDESAIVETQKKYGNYCYSIAKGILRQREDAEEVTNDTYAGEKRRISKPGADHPIRLPHRLLPVF